MPKKDTLKAPGNREIVCAILAAELARANAAITSINPENLLDAYVRMVETWEKWERHEIPI